MNCKEEIIRMINGIESEKILKILYNLVVSFSNEEKVGE